MKVLIITTDLYIQTGGGQTVYKKIIQSSPNTEFFYFIDREKSNTLRPPNAHVIRTHPRYKLELKTSPLFPLDNLSQFEVADQIARSVAGQRFDIVDVPDFYQCGSFLRAAFAHHNVTVGRVVLAMHGNISDSIVMNWGSDGDNILALQSLEQAQFSSVDGAYGISSRYIKKWQSVLKRDVYYIDPAHFLNVPIQVPKTVFSSSKPSIYCIGRSERRKGNDLFIELIRWLREGSFAEVSHIGDQDYSFQGIGSAYILGNIAKQRGLLVEHHSSLNYCELGDLFSKHSIVVLPVRYDTLNLTALDALFSGTPVAISSMAGVCDYLDEVHPGLPYIKIDLNDFYSSVSNLQDLVDNYLFHRERLLSYIATHPIFPTTSLDIEGVYRRILDEPINVSSLSNEIKIIYKEKESFPKFDFPRFLKNVLSQGNYNFLRHVVRSPRGFITRKIKSFGYFGDAKFINALLDSKSIANRFRYIAGQPEKSINQIREKLVSIYENASNPLYRCNFWLDISRMERILGNELIAVTYELRILRLLGDDRLGLLPKVEETLLKHGFLHEVKAVQAMFSDSATAERQVYGYLKETYSRNLNRLDKPFEILDDRRTGQAKVAVVVSLYKAAPKIKFFLTALSQQTLLKKGAVEVILIDSGSPTNDREVVQAFLEKTPLNLVYARSAERETIQSAWNRGIGLAHAPYLVFLGVDETLYPEGLEMLADKLEENSDVDWVMANSLVTAVEETGLFKHDIMPYDRTGAGKDHVYLETCYLSWVGGMYRKTLHERFGYYDETFGAAGDTEFKNRILPYIQVEFIPKMLGLFLNYPDGQTTASPKAEIEDIRAWYIHRTLGGVRYAFENRSEKEAEKLLCTALGYRKSYCGHLSSDIEYAFYLGQYIKSRNSSSTIVDGVEEGLFDMLKQMRDLEFIEGSISKMGSIAALVRAKYLASLYQTKHREVLKSISWPCYTVLNDNRYEQHSWLWKSN